MDFHFLRKPVEMYDFSPYGLEIKKYIDVILNNLDELEQTISDFHREDKIIRIASVYPLAGSFIPELIQSCSVKFPFAIYNGMTPDILHGLETMTYDLGFCSGHPSSELFEYCPVQKSYVGIVVPKGHELITNGLSTFEILLRTHRFSSHGQAQCESFKNKFTKIIKFL